MVFFSFYRALNLYYVTNKQSGTVRRTPSMTFPLLSVLCMKSKSRFYYLYLIHLGPLCNWSYTKQKLNEQNVVLFTIPQDLYFFKILAGKINALTVIFYYDAVIISFITKICCTKLQLFHKNTWKWQKSVLCSSFSSVQQNQVLLRARSAHFRWEKGLGHTDWFASF